MLRQWPCIILKTYVSTDLHKSCIFKCKLKLLENLLKHETTPYFPYLYLYKAKFKKKTDSCFQCCPQRMGPLIGSGVKTNLTRITKQHKVYTNITERLQYLPFGLCL